MTRGRHDPEATGRHADFVALLRGRDMYINFVVLEWLSADMLCRTCLSKEGVYLVMSLRSGALKRGGSVFEA